MITSKTCTRCEITKPIDEFARKMASYASRCKFCVRELNREENAKKRRELEARKTASRASKFGAE